MIITESQKTIHSKLEEINQLINENYSEIPEIGVLTGISGMALFHFYYSKYSNSNNYEDMGLEILMKGIDRINKGNIFPTYCTGLAGFGWVVNHLQKEGFMEVDNDELLEGLDNYLFIEMTSTMKAGHYDFLHGALGYGFYFLKRFKNTRSEKLKKRYKIYLLELIDLLEKSSKKEGDKIKWLSVLNKKTDEKVYSFGLAHGIPSIVNFLARLYVFEDFKTKVNSMLMGGLEYILSHFKEEQNASSSLFPGWIKEGEKISRKSRVAWCNGDLGVGLAIWQASISLGDSFLASRANNIFKYSTNRNSPGDSLVRDAGLCHGSFGNAQIFNRMYQETGEKIYKDTAGFWVDDGLKKAFHKDGFAGYKQWRGPEEPYQAKLSVLEGIAGIGLSMISHLSGDNSWDECLLIG